MTASAGDDNKNDAAMPMPLQDLEQDFSLNARSAVALELRHRAIEASANAMLITGGEKTGYAIEYVNPAFERITGYRADEVIGQNCRFLQGNDHDQFGVEQIRQIVREKRSGNVVLRNYRKDNSLFWNHLHVSPVYDAEGEVTHFVSSQYDITGIKADEARLTHQAYHDELTDLPNRRLLRERLFNLIASTSDDTRHMWVVFIDLDRFKGINDSYGHMVGDDVLRIVAKRLNSVSSRDVTVARWGGDEFVMVLTQSGLPLATEALQDIMELIGQPVEVGANSFFLTCSIGVAQFPHDGQDADALLTCADIAVSRAKNSGKNNFSFYTAEMHELANQRSSLEAELRQAIEKEEFVLHYQPQVDLKTGAVVGAEALIRWQHPRLGLLPPAQFINTAEESGLIVTIGSWVLKAACQQNRQWQSEGLPPIRIAVNFSARQFAQQDPARTIASTLEEVGLPAEYLEVELTESLVMNDVEEAIGILNDLKAIGIRISIDDFGTGYSSLSYLKRLPIDVLKIDRAFVTAIGEDDDCGPAVARAIITLGHAMNMKVIAEGVETPLELDYLRANGCDEMQGYFFSRPLPAEGLSAMLRAGKAL